MKRLFLIVLLVVLFALGGCSKSASDASVKISKVIESEKQDELSTQATRGNDVNSPVISEDKLALPALSEFETLMTNAVMGFYDEAGIDAVEKGYLLKEYEVSEANMPDTDYEYLISCTYGPNKTFGLIGNANNGRVEVVFTFVPLIGVDFDGDDLPALATMVMIPAGLFDDEYSNVDGLYSLME